MATCRFHGHKTARTYCPTCRAHLCESCGKPGHECPLCRRTKLVTPDRGPRGAIAAPTAATTCANHPSRQDGLKTCQACRRRYCPDCMKFGGTCVSCAQAEEEARAAMQGPELQQAPERQAGRKRRAREVDRKFKKGRKRAAIRWAIALAVLAVVGGILIADYTMLKGAADQAAARRRPAAGAAGSPVPQTADDAIAQLDAKPVTAQDADQLDRMIEAADRGGPPPAPRPAGLAALFGGPGSQKPRPSPRALTEAERKVLRALSEAGNQAAAPPPAAAAPRPRSHVAPAAPRPAAWQVGMVGLRRGQKVRGSLAISARVAGAGPLDHLELQVNGQWVGLCNQLPYRFEWDTRGNANGPVNVQVVAIAADGSRHVSRPVRVTIAN